MSDVIVHSLVRARIADIVREAASARLAARQASIGRVAGGSTDAAAAARANEARERRGFAGTAALRDYLTAQ